MRSLSFRFLLAFIAIIVITTLSACVPAYMVIRTELDKQAWKHVSDGGLVTMALLEAEKDRLENLAVLISQRPTLQNLAQQRDTEALNEYLKTFQETVDLDILILSNESGQVLANGAEFLPSIGSTNYQEAFFQTLPGARTQLGLLISKPIPIDNNREIFVTVGIVLDDDFAETLSSETGFEHSFLIGEERVATTLRNAPSAIALDAVRRASASGTMETAQLDLQNSHYYVVLTPLPDANGEIVALSEVILPIENLLAANQIALIVLILSTVLVAIAASGLAVYLTRKLTVTLKDLTAAAIKISQGDLNSPVPVPDSSSEIVTLATAFEKSRETTLRALEDLSRSKVWSETLIQSVVEGIVTIDAQGKVTSFNQGAEQITGWKSSEVVGMPANQVFPLVDGDDEFMRHLPLSDSVQRVTDPIRA